MQMSKYDLIQHISGAEENGMSKCTTSVQLFRENEDGKIVNIEDEFITSKPIIQISNQVGGYVLVDLIFDSSEDIDLHIIYSYLDKFFDYTASTNDEETDFPLIHFAFFPESLEGRYWALGLNPIFYALTPDDTRGEPRIIRLAFISQDDCDALPNFLFLESSEEELEKLRVEEDLYDEVQ